MLNADSKALKPLFLRAATVLMLACVFSMPALAQESDAKNQPKESYTQQVENMFNQSDNQAKSQFDKNYPKPSVPKTPPSAPPPPIENQKSNDQNSINKDKDSAGWQQPKGWEPPAPVQNWGAQQSQKNTNASTASGSQQTQSQNSAPNNIYLPPSSNSANSSSNPYRQG